MFHKLVDTADDRTIAMIRVILGIVFFAHGAQKALGLFGGPGFSRTHRFFPTNRYFSRANGSRDRGRVPGRTGSVGRTSHAHCCARNHCQYGRSRLDCTQQGWLLYELVR